MRYFIDHNVTAVAIAYLGFFESADDILTAPGTTVAEVEAMRHIIREVVTGRATLVYSDTCLETLRRTLVRGGLDFEALDEESALDAVEVLRVLSQASAGYVTDEAVADIRPHARSVVGQHYGKAQGQICDEDLTVTSNALAGQADVIVTFDGGFFNAAANLARYDVAVIRPNRFIRAVKAA